MNKTSSFPKMKRYLRCANAIALLIAFIVGLVIGLQDGLKASFYDKYTYIVFLMTLFTLYYISIECGASRILKREGIRLCVSIVGNPFLKLCILQLSLLVVGGWMIAERYQLTTLLSYVALSVLVMCFVGGIFESFRLIKRSV